MTAPTEPPPAGPEEIDEADATDGPGATDGADATDRPDATDRAERDAGPPPSPFRSRFTLLDLLDESVLSVSAKPARLILTMVGCVAGIAALVATLGLAQTASGQIAERFDAVAATRVVAQMSEAAARAAGPDGSIDPETMTLPRDAAARVARLAGVMAAATYSPVDTGGALVSGVDTGVLGAGSGVALPLVATSGDLLGTEIGTLAAGRMFDVGHGERADPVVVLGHRAAERLGVTRIDIQPSVFIGDRPYLVVGILAGVERRTDLLDSVILPDGTAYARFTLAAPAQVDIRTAVGAAQQVGAQAPIALRPNDPALIDTQVPPKPGRLAENVTSDVNALFLAFGVVALIVGGLGIANVTLLSVLERSGEIGLRRAVGARRRHIAAQFLVESGLVGLLGGLIGTALGVIGVVVTAAVQHWTPILDARLALLAPLVGATIGLLAGCYPAWKAASIEPITAMRGGL